uniref:Neurotransmitter-gated ion-channel ligand-binding domain-containing protein n=1 Tax=Plectus sambesii TaxID=2011161 RepID=A0A914V8E5_9BILA
MIPATFGLILFCTVEIFQAEAVCDEHAVVDKIFSNYNPDVRPVRDQSTPSVIKFQLFISSIVNINEQDETLSLLVWMHTTWKDEFLNWNMADTNQNCTSIKTRARKLWTPDAVFTNTIDITPIVVPDQQWLAITNEGIVSMTKTAFITVRCTMKIADFPFDTQRCPLQVTVWTYEYQDLQLTLSRPTTGLVDIFSNTSEFQTISLDVVPAQTSDENQTFSELHYTLVLKRFPEYYIFVIIIPTFLLTSLCIIGIFTPNSNINERNERVTLGLTTLLSMAVILNIVADQMPKSSEGLPLLGYFILYEIAVCTLAIILATIVLWVHQKAHTRAWHAPRLLYWLTQTKPPQDDVSPSYFDKYFAMKEDPKHLLVENRKEFAELTAFDHLAKMISVAKETCEKLQVISSMIERKIQFQERKETNSKVWLKTVDMIDVFLLIFLLIANIVLTSVLFR